MTELELQLIPTEELTKELRNRFSSMVVIGVQDKIAKDTDNYYDDFSGGIAVCIGLCEIMKERLQREFWDSRNDDRKEL